MWEAYKPKPQPPIPAWDRKSHPNSATWFGLRGIILSYRRFDVEVPLWARIQIVGLHMSEPKSGLFFDFLVRWKWNFSTATCTPSRAYPYIKKLVPLQRRSEIINAFQSLFCRSDPVNWEEAKGNRIVSMAFKIL